MAACASGACVMPTGGGGRVAEGPNSETPVPLAGLVEQAASTQHERWSIGASESISFSSPSHPTCSPRKMAPETGQA